MTTPIVLQTTEQPTGKAARLGRDDPLLQELWAAKSAFNAASG
jgi:hypothetical protein